jgi:hypothetical protein
VRVSTRSSPSRQLLQLGISSTVFSEIVSVTTNGGSTFKAGLNFLYLSDEIRNKGVRGIPLLDRTVGCQLSCNIKTEELTSPMTNG